jgi:hypothetical protein
MHRAPERLNDHWSQHSVGHRFIPLSESVDRSFSERYDARHAVEDKHAQRESAESE